jgi:hypothetical protein
MPVVNEGAVQVCQAVGRQWEGTRREGQYWVVDSETRCYVNDRGEGQSIAHWFELREDAESAAKFYTRKHRTKDWHDQLVSLVADCIVHHENGFDVLLSSCWDRVVEHWAASRD